MNPNQLTQKSAQAITAAQSLAVQNGNSQLAQFICSARSCRRRAVFAARAQHRGRRFRRPALGRARAGRPAAQGLRPGREAEKSTSPTRSTARWTVPRRTPRALATICFRRASAARAHRAAGRRPARAVQALFFDANASCRRWPPFAATPA